MIFLTQFFAHKSYLGVDATTTTWSLEVENLLKKKSLWLQVNAKEKAWF